MANKKYKVIYCDAPWSFKTYSEKGKEKKSPELHYGCMTIDDIYNLPVNSIADDDCVLFHWVTSPMLKEGIQTLESWGFTYKTIGFNWFKQNKIADSFFWGLGYWTRQNTELCLIGTKGKPSRVSKGVQQPFETENPFGMFDTEQIKTRIERHSQKPAIVRNRIVDLMGDVPRIELFARERVQGWSAWGNELEYSDIDFSKVG